MNKKNDIHSDLFSNAAPAVKALQPKAGKLATSPKHSTSESASPPATQNLHAMPPAKSHHTEVHHHENPSRKKGPTTRIIVKYDVGFNNSVYLRGEGADLSWDRGILLKNIRADEWLWETNILFSKCEFKVLINDRQYELGENHHLQCGTSFEYTPSFHLI